MAKPKKKPAVESLKKVVYKIGVIADTHNRWLPQLSDVFRGVNEIWHLGDVCDEAGLDELRAITSNVLVVLGNNDHTLNYPETRRVQRGKETFYLIHILPERMPADTDWVLFGHTHSPSNDIYEGVHVFNPGSAGKGNKGSPPSVGLLIQEEGDLFRAEVIQL
jgi:putative phosphoesterase